MAKATVAVPRKSAQVRVPTPKSSPKAKYLQLSWVRDGFTLNVDIRIDELIAQGIPASRILKAARLRHDPEAMKALLRPTAGKHRS